jgi:hypothetical protein
MLFVLFFLKGEEDSATVGGVDCTLEWGPGTECDRGMAVGEAVGLGTTLSGMCGDDEGGEEVQWQTLRGDLSRVTLKVSPKPAFTDGPHHCFKPHA